MTFNMGTVLESKEALRRRLATLPIGEKLRMLDTLRERELAIRSAVAKAELGTSGDPAPTEDLADR